MSLRVDITDEAKAVVERLRETHKMMLDHYRHTKNVLMSFDKNPMGFF